jgi:hypothetical protein
VYEKEKRLRMTKRVGKPQVFVDLTWRRVGFWLSWDRKCKAKGGGVNNPSTGELTTGMQSCLESWHEA